MAVKEFNCNKLKRTFWPFTLKDKVDENGNAVEKGKKIVVRMPPVSYTHLTLPTILRV